MIVLGKQEKAPWHSTVVISAPSGSVKGECSMCGENESKIPVYWLAVDGDAGPCEKTIKAVLDDVETELEEHKLGGGERVITIRTGEMREAEYDALPEFEGY